VCSLERFLIAEEYDCSYTLYRGPLLGEPFIGLDSLEYLSLGGNTYDSSVPLEIASLPNLKRLYLEESSLTGSLDFVASMDSMVELWLDSNNFDSTIPTTIGTVTTLGSLSLSNNFFISGTIPTEIANVKRMGKFLYHSYCSMATLAGFHSRVVLRILSKNNCGFSTTP
jgi:hypothetical protein